MQATADSTKMDCVWSNWKSQGILFISVMHACLRRTGTRDPDSAIVHHFTCGNRCMLYPQELSVGWRGVNLLCQKSKWIVFDVFFPLPFFSPFIFPPTTILFVFLL